MAEYMETVGVADNCIYSDWDLYPDEPISVVLNPENFCIIYISGFPPVEDGKLSHFTIIHKARRKYFEFSEGPDLYSFACGITFRHDFEGRNEAHGRIDRLYHVLMEKAPMRGDC